MIWLANKMDISPTTQGDEEEISVDKKRTIDPNIEDIQGVCFVSCFQLNNPISDFEEYQVLWRMLRSKFLLGMMLSC